MKTLLFAAALTLGFAGTARGEEVAADIDAAKALFARYEALEAAFDPAVADLYCDSARIVNRRTMADGEVRELTLPAVRYKALIRSAMPLAQARGDRSEYRDVVYAIDGDGVRITATRHSFVEDHDSPLSLWVGDCAGTPAILEELSASRG